MPFYALNNGLRRISHHLPEAPIQEEHVLLLPPRHHHNPVCVWTFVFKPIPNCPSSYTGESVMEGAHTDCPVSIYHEVSGVISNSCTDAPLVKEILREKEEYCVGSRESSSVVVSKKRRLPFRHVQQKTIPRLLKTVTVYLLKFR